MYLKKKELEELMNRSRLFQTGFDMDDLAGVFDLVSDIMEAEADAIKKGCPTATNTISRLEKAAYEVFSMGGEISNEVFDEGSEQA